MSIEFTASLKLACIIKLVRNKTLTIVKDIDAAVKKAVLEFTDQEFISVLKMFTNATVLE